MNALRKSRLGFFVVAVELLVFLQAGAASAGIGVGFGGIGISVGRGGQRGGYGPGQRLQSGRKQAQNHRNGSTTRNAPRVTTNQSPAPSSQTTTKPKAAPATTKPTATPVAASKKTPQLPFELVDVRLIDIGNTELGEGPRFRVVVKNAAKTAMKQPLELMISAGISDAFNPELPTAVQTVEKLAPGQTAPIELRLPAESMAMAYPGRKEPYPFSTLFVLIGGPKNILGSSSISQLAVLPLGEVHLADIAIAAPAKREVPVGLPLELKGEGFGPQTGRVQMTVGGVKLDLEILAWSELGIAVQMPKLALSEPTKVQLQVVRADGQPAKALAMTAVLPDASAIAAAEEVPFPTSPTPPAATETKVAATPTPVEPEPAAEAAAEPATPQQPLSLAQAFGGLGLPPSDEKSKN